MPEEFNLEQELAAALSADNEPAEAESVENEQVADVHEETPEVKQPIQPEGKTEKDSFYADMRRKQELDRNKAELNQLKQQNARREERLQSVLSRFFEGNTLEEMLDTAQARAEGISTEELHQRQREVAAQQAQVDEAAALRGQVEYYQQLQAQQMMDNDLKEIQAIDPTVTSLADLPPMFVSLRFNDVQPMSAKEAFLAAKNITEQTKTPKPASTGSMTSSAVKEEKEYFTSEELDNLTSKDLDKPGVFEKAMRSMERLGRK